MSMFRCVVGVAAIGLLLAAPNVIQANTTYGSPLQAGWNIGSGMSNANFAVTTEVPPPVYIELGLKAHARFAGDLPQSQGTYIAQPGTSYYSGGGHDVSTWNFNLSVAFAHGQTDPFALTWANGLGYGSGSGFYHEHFGTTTVKLFVDFDPAVGNAGRGVMNLSALLAAGGLIDPSLKGLQLSENVMFNWLQDPAAWEVYPTFDPEDFNPHAVGSYEFSLVAIRNNEEVAQVDMTVQVVPEPLTVLGVLLGVGGVAGYVRRRRSL